MQKKQIIIFMAVIISIITLICIYISRKEKFIEESPITSTINQTGKGYCDTVPEFPITIQKILAHPKGDTPRTIVIQNKSKNDLYISFDGAHFDGTAKGLLINPEIYSGFKVASNDFYALELPYHVDSGRIWVRTNCEMSFGYIGGHPKASSLWCDTGNCPIPDAGFVSSDSGKLCYTASPAPGSILGGIGPTTPVEFTFNPEGIDFYDISQVDGNNISVSIIPISNNYAPKPHNTSDEFWCKNSSCYPTESKNSCPPELRVYTQGKNGQDGEYVTCQSICQAISSIPDNYVENSPGGLWPNGKLSNGIDILKLNDIEGYNTLMKLYNSGYIWDDTYTDPNMTKDPSGINPNRPWFNKGRWVLKPDNRCTIDDENSGKCLRVKTVTCCEGMCDVSDTAENGGTNNSVKQGCSPYDSHFQNEDYKKHLCWSEMWPKPSSQFCSTNGLVEQDCNYHTLYKKQCPKAYSWQFDDFNSTYTCKSSNDKPINYYIGFCDKI